MSALRECEFCRGPAELMELFEGFYGSCKRCEATGPARKTEAAAIAAWNRRAGDAEVEKLRAELAAAREALRNAADAIERADPEILTCTLWMPDDVSPNETVVDHLRAALGDTP